MIATCNIQGSGGFDIKASNCCVWVYYYRAAIYYYVGIGIRNAVTTAVTRIVPIAIDRICPNIAKLQFEHLTGTVIRHTPVQRAEKSIWHIRISCNYEPRGETIAG